MLRLGLFGANCSSGRTYATLSERWDASWENNLALAQRADEIGLDCLVPIARWKGYGGDSNPNGTSFESIAWASGLLAATRRIDVFCTVHVPLHHPLVAAKQIAKADHIGRGRLGLNCVCGWNEDEFRTFGIDKHEHDARYAQGAEWWSIVKRVWAAGDRFDHDGVYYTLRGVEGSPRPYGGRVPLMMNAGSSPAGRAFAIRHSDMHFDAIVWTPVGIICQPTQREASDYLRYIVDHADLGAIGYLAEMQRRDGRPATDPQGRQLVSPLERRTLARGSYCVIGDPDAVARELARLHAVGLDGVAINFVDYLAELPFFAAEVLPRLDALGIRQT